MNTPKNDSMRISKCLSKLSLTICTLLMIGATGWAQPTNDACTTATLVSAYPETLSGPTVYVRGTTPGSCAAVTCVTSNDDIGFGGGCTQSNGHSRSKVDWSTVAGSTYYIYLDGFATTTGTYDLFVEETIPAPLTL